MFEGAKAKQSRDEELGLVFGWRRTHSSFGGTFVASIITALLVVFCIYSLRIPLAEIDSGAGQLGQSLTIFPRSQTESLWVSPALSQLESVIARQTRFVPENAQRLRELPEIESVAELPSVFADGLEVFPEPALEALPVESKPLPVFGGSKPQLISTGNEGIRLDVPDDVALGSVVRCQVLLDSNGFVVECWVSEASSDRLRTQVLQVIPRRRFVLGERDEAGWRDIRFVVRAGDD